MKVVMVFEPNKKRCKHELGIGQTCHDCAKIRGIFLQEQIKDLKRKLADYDKWFEINSANLVGLDMNVANKGKNK